MARCLVKLNHRNVFHTKILLPSVLMVLPRKQARGVLRHCSSNMNSSVELRIQNSHLAGRCRVRHQTDSSCHQRIFGQVVDFVESEGAAAIPLTSPDMRSLGDVDFDWRQNGLSLGHPLQALELGQRAVQMLVPGNSRNHATAFLTVTKIPVSFVSWSGSARSFALI
jgi:hypothetical protein